MKQFINVFFFLLWMLAPSQAFTEESNRQLTILAINDVYRLDNLPYLRTLREQLEKASGNVLLLHAGDFLFPSLLSRRYKGQQMVDALNHLDGDDKAFDPYMFVIFGNHEFDKSRLKHANMLQKRIQESQFYWLNSNVEFKKDATGQPLVQAQQMLPSRILEVNGIHVGLLGVVTDVKSAEYIERFLSPKEVLRKGIADLRSQGAEIVIAITHIAMSQDKAILEALGDDGPDLVIGGHEHDRQTALVNGRRIVKGDADAKTVSVLTIELERSARPDIQLEFIDLPGKYSPDRSIEQLAVRWKKRFNTEYCKRLGMLDECMNKQLGRTDVELIAEELSIRKFESNLGNWLTDLARNSFSDKGAQIAFLNSGGMRLNENIAAGSVITRRHIDTLFAYPTRLVMIKITGDQLQHVVSHSVSNWTGNGHWLQISGFTFKHDPEGSKAYDLNLITDSGLKPIKADDVILAVVNSYLLDEKGGQDGYTMLNSSMLLESNAKPPDLSDIVIETLQQIGDKGIAPKREGRICNVRNRLECPINPKK